MNDPAERSTEKLQLLILAAGGSSRFGSPKQMASIGAVTMLRAVADTACMVCPPRLLPSLLPRVGIVLGAHHEKIEPSLQGIPAALIYNPAWEQGLSTSIRVGIAQLPEDCPAVLLLLGDQARVGASALRALISQWSQHPERIVASAYNDTVGVPAIFPASCFADLCALQGDAGAKQILAQNASRLLTIPHPEAAFDIDCPSDVPSAWESSQRQESSA